MFFDVSGVKGDVETPLSMILSTGVLSGGAQPDTIRFISHLATRRRGDPAALTWFVQCESMTMGTDTTNNANAADSGGNAARCSFATLATMVLRVYTTFPAAPNDEIRGTYRVYLRCRKSASGSGPMNVQFSWGSVDAGGMAVSGPVTSIGFDVGPSAPTFRYIDLGTVTIPPMAPGEDFGGRPIQPEGIFLAVGAQRVSGTGSLDLDVILLIPADDQTLLVRWPGTGVAGAQDVMLDPVGRVGSAKVPALSVYARTVAGLTRALQPAELRGGTIDIQPGVTNRVWFVKDVGLDNPDNGGGDDKAATVTITPMYHPRYVQHMRPATT
jgi:hypothetical protein